ncbi:MAG: cellulose synthase subunit BcsC-related outer membrane protein [Myxococcales bacterium]
MRPLICILLVASAALAQDAAAPLARNAWYWQARARSDKAEEAWKNVLKVAPENAEALAALGGFAARSGRLDEARSYLARLVKANPKHPEVAVLQREVTLGPRFGPMLIAARKLVHEGKHAQGAAKYAELFGEAGPPGDLALEYYQTLAGVSGGWQRAREGLTKIVKRAQGEPRFQLELGKILTYREQTRREGIEMLAAVARDPSVGKDAATAWREALLWLPPDDAAIPLLRAYQRTHPADVEIGRRIERGKHASALKAGFAALDRGDTAEAERIFRAYGDDPDAKRGLSILAERRTSQQKQKGFSALKRGDVAGADEMFRSAGKDADAKLGLALVAQREALAAQQEGDFARARELLERARKLAPKHREIWEAPLRGVAFWSLLHDAKLAHDAGREDEAEAKLLEALSSAPEDEKWHAQLELGNSALRRGRRASAESRFREVLRDMPDQPDALRALVGILAGSSRFQEAAALNERLLRNAPQLAMKQGWLRAEILRAEAGKSRAAHSFEDARKKLVEARAADPGDIWVLHDLANLLLEMGSVAEAQPLVAELLHNAPQMPEAQVTGARLLVAQEHPKEALAVLKQVRGVTDPSVAQLRRQLEVQVAIPELVARRDSAGLAAIERQVADSPELAASVAVAWSRLGDSRRAVKVMRAAMARAPSATRGAQFELAATLLRAGDDVEVEQFLEGLMRDERLTPIEQRTLADLRVAHAVQVADRSRERGEPQVARRALDAVLRDFPRDPRLLGAEARLLERSDPRRAHSLFLAVRAANPRDFDALRGAVTTAPDAGSAHALASEAVRQRPGDPLAHFLVAQADLRADDDASAMHSLEVARGLTQGSRVAQSTVSYEPGVGTAAAAPGDEERAAARDDAALRADIAREMQQIHDRHRPEFDGAGTVRQRNGELGLGALVDWRQTARVALPLGYSARLLMEGGAVELFSGAPAASAASRFGTGGGRAGYQQVSGAPLSLGIDSRHFSGFVGTTPIGFPVFSVVGSATLRGSLGPLRVSASGGRRSIDDSLLSYAGTTDPATGRRWGGVVYDNGRLDLALSYGILGLYGYGDGGRLIGFNVADNARIGGGGGFDVALLRSADVGEIKIGAGASALSYRKNLSGFTFGQGGYFSPQRFFHGGVNLSWRREGAVRWEAVVEPGYDHSEEAVSAIFPLDPASDTANGAISSGASFNAQLALGFKLGSRVETALTGSVQRAPEFQEVRAGLVLRLTAP